MYTTFHLNSAEEISMDILDAIKKAYKTKAITITVEEDLDDTTYLLQNEVNREKLLKSIEEDKQGLSISVDIPL